MKSSPVYASPPITLNQNRDDITTSISINSVNVVIIIINNRNDKYNDKKQYTMTMITAIYNDNNVVIIIVPVHVAKPWQLLRRQKLRRPRGVHGSSSRSRRRSLTSCWMSPMASLVSAPLSVAVLLYQCSCPPALTAVQVGHIHCCNYCFRECHAMHASWEYLCKLCVYSHTQSSAS